MGILTHEGRQEIRRARAAEVAAERALAIKRELQQVCRQCGCDSDPDSLAYTEGCAGCWERKRARRGRGYSGRACRPARLVSA